MIDSYYVHVDVVGGCPCLGCQALGLLYQLVNVLWLRATNWSGCRPCTEQPQQ